MPKVKKANKQRPEDVLRAKVIDHLKTKYPGVKYIVNASGEFVVKQKSDFGKINKMKKQGVINSYMPDIFICKSRAKYNGLFVELKADGVKIVKQNGEIVSDQDINNQAKVLDELTKEGYFCTFAIGYKEAINYIDSYLSNSGMPRFKRPQCKEKYLLPIWARNKNETGEF